MCHNYMLVKYFHAPHRQSFSIKKKIKILLQLTLNLWLNTQQCVLISATWSKNVRLKMPIHESADRMEPELRLRSQSISWVTSAPEQGCSDSDSDRRASCSSYKLEGKQKEKSGWERVEWAAAPVWWHIARPPARPPAALLFLQSHF